MSPAHPGREPIGVVGVGWVGLVTAVCFADLGHEVWCVDVDREKLAELSRGQVRVHEPGLSDAVAHNAGRLHFGDDLSQLFANARLAFICVDTPPTASGDADLSRVQAVLDALPPAAGGSLLVMKSTVPVGTGRRLRYELDARGLGTVGYASNPEFLREGSALRDFVTPDRVVVGADEPVDAERIESLYAPITDRIVTTDIASAEMIKMASNAFLATKISFINEIANVCEEVGADVDEVARGMGLDTRIGASFLRPGIGYGGSCLAGDETVLVRRHGATRLVALETLFDELAADAPPASVAAGLVEPAGLDVLSWAPGEDAPSFRPVAAATRRPFDGELVEVVTKMGRRVRCTPDHPFVVGSASGDDVCVRTADELDEAAWLPLAEGASVGVATARELDLVAASAPAGIVPTEIIVRLDESEMAALRERTTASVAVALGHHRGRARVYDVARAGALRLDEAQALGVSLSGASLGTARNGTYVPSTILAEARFWRVAGLYLAEGHCAHDGARRRLTWSFHPTDEGHLVDEVASYWGSLGVKATVQRTPTTMSVSVSSRVLAALFLDVLRLGRTAYDHRIPDAIWDQGDAAKRALLSGLWAGDGSWSLVSGGPSVVLEYGTVSRALADGVLRLLGDLGLVARLKVGRTAKSTVDTYWLCVSGADQIERAAWLVGPAARPAIAASLARQSKRIAPTGYRRHASGTWARVVRTSRQRFAGPVYSLEVPGTETFVTTGGLVTHNCFPKDVAALKQLAGNTGYHFQLLSAVIEVNELQKRRVIAKLKRHLGELRDRRVALWGLAFKPNTNDMREASSIVLASRLVAEGARVVAYDPVVGPGDARGLPDEVEIAPTALDAADGADALVIVTEWPEFAAPILDGTLASRLAGRLVVDGRNLLDGDAVRAAGFTYEGVGRGAAELPTEA